MLSRFLERHQELTTGQKPSPPIPWSTPTTRPSSYTDAPPERFSEAIRMFSSGGDLATAIP
jgi:hypothetical protein